MPLSPSISHALAISLEEQKNRSPFSVIKEEMPSAISIHTVSIPPVLPVDSYPMRSFRLCECSITSSHHNRFFSGQYHVDVYPTSPVLFLSYSTSVCLEVIQSCPDSIFLIFKKSRGAPNLDRLDVFINFEISSSFCFSRLSNLCDFSCYIWNLVAMLCSMWYSLCVIYLVWVYSLYLTLCDFPFCVMF